MANQQPLSTNYDTLADLVAVEEVDGFVHVNEGTDDLLQYLTRVDGEDRNYGFIQTKDSTAVVVTPRYIKDAQIHFPGDEIIEVETDKSIVDQIQAYLEDEPEIRIPDTMPVGIVNKLDNFASVKLVEEPDTVWCQKNQDEIEILQNVAKGVQRGIARAETVLAQAEVNGDQLLWNGDQLTTDRLRAEIRKTLADDGLTDSGSIIIGAGETCWNLHFTGNDVIRPHETVLIDLGPRNSEGYYGDITRTFVPGEPSEWERKVYSAVDEALESAFDTLKNGAGITAGELYEAMASTIEAHGYKTGLHETKDNEPGLTHGTGHGIGVRIHEKPFQTEESDTALEAGNVFTIEPGIYHPERGGVRLEDVVVLQENGFENLMSYPRQIEPREREQPYNFL